MTMPSKLVNILMASSYLEKKKEKEERKKQ